jgi:hypothetical protein
MSTTFQLGTPDSKGVCSARRVSRPGRVAHDGGRDGSRCLVRRARGDAAGFDRLGEVGRDALRGREGSLPGSARSSTSRTSSPLDRTAQRVVVYVVRVMLARVAIAADELTAVGEDQCDANAGTNARAEAPI